MTQLMNLNDVNTLVDERGLPYAVAAVSEGFCPTHSRRLTQDPRPDTDHQDEVLIATAAGYCSECPAWWSTGTTDEKGDWLSIQDVYLDANRRLTFNPPDDPPDDYENDW